MGSFIACDIFVYTLYYLSTPPECSLHFSGSAVNWQKELSTLGVKMKFNPSASLTFCLQNEIVFIFNLHLMNNENEFVRNAGKLISQLLKMKIWIICENSIQFHLFQI